MRLAVIMMVAGGCARPAPLPPPAALPVSTVTPSEPTVPADARARYLDAAVAERLGDADRAEVSYRWVTRLDGTRPWSWLALGRFLERQRRGEEASAAYRRAVQADPSLGEAHLALGSSLVRRGKLDEGLEPLAEASRLGHPQGHHLYARALLLAGRTTDAEQVLARWREQPAEGDTAFDRARLAYELGQDDAVLDDLLVADWLMAPTPAGDLLVDAARRSCRIGDAWRIVRGNGMAARLDPAWPRTTATVARIARDEALWAQASTEPWRPGKPACSVPAPSEPTCADVSALWAHWQATPTDHEAWQSWVAMARACDAVPRDVDVEQIDRWLGE